MLKTLLSAFLLTLVFAANARTYLVSVGIADYSGFPSKIDNLHLAANDARTIAELYSANTSVNYSLLLNDKATKTRILKAIAKVFSRAEEDDIVVFFFSGHGYPGGFCACDGNLGYDEVRRAMSQSRSRNKVMFADACRAGCMRVDESSPQETLSAARRANVMLFLSSRNTENSIERRFMKNGLFTSCLLKGLKGNADADRDRVITAKELFDFVHHRVVKASGGTQHPVMWGSFDGNMTVMKW